MSGRQTAKTQIKLCHAFDQVLIDRTSEARKVVVHPSGFAICRDQPWPLLETCNPRQALSKAAGIQKQNALLFYRFSLSVDYVLWINLGHARAARRRVRCYRSPASAPRLRAIPCLSGAIHHQPEHNDHPSRQTLHMSHAGGMDCSSPSSSSGATPPIPPRE